MAVLQCIVILMGNPRVKHQKLYREKYMRLDWVKFADLPTLPQGILGDVTLQKEGPTFQRQSQRFFYNRFTVKPKIMAKALQVRCQKNV